jgi:plasmid stability protein
MARPLGGEAGFGSHSKQIACSASNYAVMATIHVREVSDDAVVTLKVRAARAGQSLQAYVRQLLEREAATVIPEEAAERARVIAARSSVTADDVVDAIAAMREARA